SCSRCASIWFHHGSESARTPSRSKITARKRIVAALCYPVVASCRSCSASLRPQVANEHNGFEPRRAFSVLTFYVHETRADQARSVHSGGQFSSALDSCRSFDKKNSNSRRDRFSWAAGG